jgi:hypothetical protein
MLCCSVVAVPISVHEVCMVTGVLGYRADAMHLQLQINPGPWSCHVGSSKNVKC